MAWIDSKQSNNIDDASPPAMHKRSPYAGILEEHAEHTSLHGVWQVSNTSYSIPRRLVCIMLSVIIWAVRHTPCHNLTWWLLQILVHGVLLPEDKKNISCGSHFVIKIDINTGQYSEFLKLLSSLFWFRSFAKMFTYQNPDTKQGGQNVKEFGVPPSDSTLYKNGLL